MKKTIVPGAALGVVALLAGTAAQAAVNISTQPTQNMSCSGGVCAPTKKVAYLNVNDVTNFLAAGDLKIVTGAGGQDIHIQAPVSWTSTSRLTFDAQRSIEFEKPVSVAGTGALTLTTNDGGTGGDYWFDEGASVSFWDTSSSLVINGQSFTLVKDIKTLASDISRHPEHHYALANSYDASQDDTYPGAVVSTSFAGVFDGLGNAVSNLSVVMQSPAGPVGLFAQTAEAAIIRDLLLDAVTITHGHHNYTGSAVGGLAAINSGSVERVSVTGTFQFRGTCAGGLTAVNLGKVARSSARVSIEIVGKGDAPCLNNYDGVGELVGYNAGSLDQVFSAGGVLVDHLSATIIGGLVGWNTGSVQNSYSEGGVRAEVNWDAAVRMGGLIARTDGGSILQAVYTIAGVRGPDQTESHACDGAFLGLRIDPTSIASGYYDQQSANGLPAVSCGIDDGIVELSDAQLKSVLPEGFDPLVWGQDANINNGYPYLLANPPPKGTKAAKTSRAAIGKSR